MKIIAPVFIVLALFICAIVKFKDLKIRYIGRQGEKEVSSVLKTLPCSCRVLNDYLLPYGCGTSQIDHIVISPVGVFVVETKNYSGVIYGSDYKEIWSHYVGNKNYGFYSPIFQNNSHIDCLKVLLGENVPMYSCIVFADKCRIKAASKYAWIGNTSALKEFIEKQLKKNEVLSEERVAFLTQYLVRNRITDRRVRKRHNRAVANK